MKKINKKSIKKDAPIKNDLNYFLKVFIIFFLGTAIYSILVFLNTIIKVILYSLIALYNIIPQLSVDTLAILMFFAIILLGKLFLLIVDILIDIVRITYSKIEDLRKHAKTK
jgi:uncharacterized membrane protein